MKLSFGGPNYGLFLREVGRVNYLFYWGKTGVAFGAG